ncbi:uncharacterized protein LOC129800475 [Phlebotomus papatasi]|uniref:uncharacterized protein LOC129800475 n=1 Tax=Phlebotomus papatasi TaxID=29031 RepID=UPI0024842F06|nr:uncharacterized protein LOC129800475 [Phlebotomus papatasi]
MVGLISAAGSSIPPIYIFPRKKTSDVYMDGSPEGSIGIFNGSGYQDKDSFLETLKHLKKYALSSKESPILLLLDNHASHCHVQCIDYCRENGIIMLSFPPHTSHKTQPLDISVFGPFKRRCAKLFQAWMRENREKAGRITIHNIVKISAEALEGSFSKHNVQAGFLKAGIFPFNKERLINQAKEVESISTNLQINPEPSEANAETVETIRPLPRPLQIKNENKRTVTSMVLTNSPERDKRNLIEIKKEPKECCKCKTELEKRRGRKRKSTDPEDVDNNENKQKRKKIQKKVIYKKTQDQK